MNEPLRRPHDLGQSIWYDDIRRALLDSGGLREYVDEFAVTGVTSNPSIFDDALRSGGRAGRARSVPDHLAIAAMQTSGAEAGSTVGWNAS